MTENELPVSSFGDLLAVIRTKSNETYSHPLLIVVGKITNSINIDGAVITHIGFTEPAPVYRILPRSFNIKPNGDLKLSDDHEDWLQTNDPSEVISNSDITAAFIVHTQNKDFQIPQETEKFLTR